MKNIFSLQILFLSACVSTPEEKPQVLNPVIEAKIKTLETKSEQEDSLSFIRNYVKEFSLQEDRFYGHLSNLYEAKNLMDMTDDSLMEQREIAEAKALSINESGYKTGFAKLLSKWRQASLDKVSPSESKENSKTQTNNQTLEQEFLQFKNLGVTSFIKKSNSAFSKKSFLFSEFFCL